MTPFENIDAIKLEKGGHYYQLIQDVAKEISDNIIELNKKPEEEREKYLIEQDKVNRKYERERTTDGKESSDESNEFLQPFYTSFRSIEIVGQILKNRKGSLPKQKLTELITELYLLGFRTIGFLGNIFINAKSDLILTLLEKVEDGDSKQKVEQKINNFFQYISLQACLGIFSKLIYSIGVKELKDQYKQVAMNLDSPAAKIVTFSINSYYNDVSANEIKTIAKELENNPVAFQILRARVKAYLYYNHVDYQKKQKIAEALKMKIGPNIQRN